MSTKLNLAVVDDEEGVHKIFKAHFHKEVKKDLVHIRYFFNGKECIEYLKKEHQDLNILIVLSDINMPIMDGLSMLEIIKQDFPEIKVYMITAYDTDEYVKKTQELGADEFLVKPLDFKKLKDELNKKFSLF